MRFYYVIVAIGMQGASEAVKVCELESLKEIDTSALYWNGQPEAHRKERLLQVCNQLQVSIRADVDFYRGWNYHYGIGQEQDFCLAASYYAAAAEKRQMEAAYNLAYLYSEGKGVVQNNQTCLNWLIKAAAWGHQEAYQLLEAKKNLLIPREDEPDFLQAAEPGSCLKKPKDSRSLIPQKNAAGDL